MSKDKLIPELRFPEFKNEGKWIETTLGNIGDFIGGGTPDTTNPEYWNGDILWYTPTEVKEGKVGKSIRTITEDGLKNSSAKLLPKGSLLLTTRATIGDIAIADSECTTNQGFQSLVVKETEANSFWYYWIIQHKNELIKKASGSTFPEIGKNEITKIKSLKPKLPEQQKIASCLSSLDEVIAAHSQKLNLLKDHKKGLMQNLFPDPSASSGGEKVPKYRFKEFEKDGVWVEKSIEQIAKVTTGNKDTQNKVENGLYPFFVRSQTVERINSYSFDGEAILTSGDGVGVGKNFHYLKGKFDYHQRVYCIYDFKNDVCGEFVYMYFSQHFNERVMKMSAKNSVDSVRMAMITEMPIYMPSKKEQQKIASCLSSLDALITAQAEKIEQLKLHKKGLMQGLFPKIND